MGVEGERPRILVLDDSALVGEAMHDALTRRGFEVNVATSIARLNALLLAWSPTMVLVDVNMPGIPGTDVCRWIKERIATQDVPVLLFSDIPETDLSALAGHCGADGFVSKRKGLERVAEQVSTLCEEIVW